jgi:hypothetical protein
MAQKLQIKNGTWDQVKTRITEDSAQRRDFSTTFGDLLVTPGETGAVDFEGNPTRAEMSFIGDDKMRTMKLRDRSYGQYLNRLSIPLAFATGFSGQLQGLMIDERLRGENKPDPSTEVFVRTRPGLVRAILSGRYGDMKDLAVAEIIDQHLPNMDGYKVLRGAVTEDLFSVTLIGVDPIHRNGDSYYPIHRIHNSETGAKSFEVTSGICKGACSNGIIFAFKKDMRFRIRHLGSKMSENVEVALTAALTGQSSWADRVAPAISRASEIVIDLTDKAVETKTIKRLRDFGLTKKFVVESLTLAQCLPSEIYGQEFTHGPQVSLWGVVNAMTQLAQEMDELSRYEVEAAAGAILLAR